MRLELVVGIVTSGNIKTKIEIYCSTNAIKNRIEANDTIIYTHINPKIGGSSRLAIKDNEIRNFYYSINSIPTTKQPKDK